MKRAILATIVLLFATSAWGGTPVHGPFTNQVQTSEADTIQGKQAYADGTSWDAGQGDGFYVYDGSHWQGPVMAPSYMSIYASNVTVTINTTDTDTLATAGWTVNETSGPAYNGTTGLVTIQAGGAGVYSVDFSVSVSGQSNAAVHYHLFVAGTHDPAVESHRKLSGGDVGNAAMSNLSTFAVGDTIKVVTQQNTGTTDQTLEHGSFSIVRISP